MSWRAFGVRGVHGDIQAGKSHQLIGASESARITDLGPDDHRAQPPDTVMTLQRLAADLAASEPNQLCSQLVDLGAELIDAPQSCVHALASRGRQLGGCQRLVTSLG